MQRTLASETKLLICIWHPFSLWRPPAEFAVAVGRRWPEMKVIHLPTHDNLEKELPDTDIFVGFSIRPNQFALARKLKWIHSTAAGVGQLMFPELRRSGIFVTNVSGIHATPMAEHVLGVLSTLARRFPDCFRGQREGRWLQQILWDAPVRPRDLYGETLLLFGLGAVGKEVARLVRPLGMKIWAVTRSGRGDSQLVDRILPASEFERVL